MLNASIMSIAIPTSTPAKEVLEQNIPNLHKCSNLLHLKQIHAQIFKFNLHRDSFIAPKLVAAYSLCRQMTPSLNTFNLIPQPNVLLYNTLIRAYTQNSLHSQAFFTFFDMQRNGVFPDNFTYPFLLKACSGEFSIQQVKMIHGHVEKFGFLRSVWVPNTLVDAYSKCGESGVEIAKKVFRVMVERDVVSWNSMIGVMVRLGEMEEALRIFEEMPERDVVSWNTVLGGYVKKGDLNEAFELFEQMPERNSASWSTMISGYSKAGFMNMARMLFDKVPKKNLLHWTIMISGYAEKGVAKEALSLYDQMHKAGLQLDRGGIISILAACAESGLLALGKMIHVFVKKSRLSHDTKVCNALVDMYAKCGDLDQAMNVFEGMIEKDVISWNSMIYGLAMHGHGKAALELFSRMELEGVMPDGVTLISVLCACRYNGLINDGRHYFSIMEKYYGIAPEIEHYGCMIELLGRGGYLKEALELIKSMPMEPNAIIWGTLLEAGRMHNDSRLAEEVINQLVKLESSDATAYAILSNEYTSAVHWDVAQLRL